MSIAGIDFSSHQADVVILDEDTDHATHHVFAFGKGDAFRTSVRRIGWRLWFRINGHWRGLP